MLQKYKPEISPYLNFCRDYENSRCRRQRLPVPACTCTSLSAETTPKTLAGEGRNGSDKEAGNA